MLVHLASMPGFKRKHREFIVANIAKHAIVAYAVTPGTRKIASESFAVRTGVVAAVDVLEEPCNND